MAEVGGDLTPEIVVDRRRQAAPGERADAAEILRVAAVRREQARAGAICPGVALRREGPHLRAAEAAGAYAGDDEVRVSPELRDRAPGHMRAGLRLRSDELAAEHYPSGGRGCCHGEGGEQCDPETPEPSALSVQRGSRGRPSAGCRSRWEQSPSRRSCEGRRGRL